MAGHQEFPGTRADRYAIMCRYRQSRLHEPGKIYKHFGTVEDKVPEGPFGVGTRQPPGADVASQMKQTADSEVGMWAQEQAEGIYARCAHAGAARMSYRSMHVG
jgi:hypothetical protein